MGFFDRFKKDKNNAKVATPQVTSPRPKQPYEFQTFASEGGMFIEMIDNNYEVGKDYDTTRIFISDTPVIIAGKQLKQCFVSWYGQDDCVMLGKHGEERGRRTDYSSVITDIDMNALQNDYRYCVALMRDLFKQSRVLEYLQRSKQESPEKPCGNYIGYINENYEKHFDLSIGKAAHHTPEMQQKRAKIRHDAEKARQAEILKHQQAIKDLEGMEL